MVYLTAHSASESPVAPSYNLVWMIGCDGRGRTILLVIIPGLLLIIPMGHLRQVSEDGPGSLRVRQNTQSGCRWVRANSSVILKGGVIVLPVLQARECGQAESAIRWGEVQ